MHVNNLITGLRLVEFQLKQKLQKRVPNNLV